MPTPKAEANWAKRERIQQPPAWLPIAQQGAPRYTQPRQPDQAWRTPQTSNYTPRAQQQPPAWLPIAEQGAPRYTPQQQMGNLFKQGAPAPQSPFAGADLHVTNGIGLTTPGAPQGHNLDNHTFADKKGVIYYGVTQQADGSWEGVNGNTGDKVSISADGTVNVIPNNNGPYMLPQLGNYAPWYFSSLNPPPEQPNYWGSAYGGWGGWGGNGGGGYGGGGNVYSAKLPAWLMDLNSWNIE